MSVELYRKHRPSSFDEVIGQPDAVAMLQDLIERKRVPHALLFVGPSGCGKTTLARILKEELDCGDSDFVELNCADFRGIEMVREIRSHMSLAPMEGKSRVWLIDESHRLTSDAMAALLKMLEDTPSHVYFMLCTTDPGKLLKTIHTRCTEIKLKPLGKKDLESLIATIAEREEKELSEDVCNRIVDVADGSARKALVILHQVMGLESEEDMLEAVQSSDSKRQAIDIARLLMNPRTKWAEIAAVLKEIEDEPESIRHLVLSYATKVLLGGGQMAERAYQVINVFEGNFFDGKKASLVRACYELFGSK